MNIFTFEEKIEILIKLGYEVKSDYIIDIATNRHYNNKVKSFAVFKHGKPYKEPTRFYEGVQTWINNVFKDEYDYKIKSYIKKIMLNEII